MPETPSFAPGDVVTWWVTRGERRLQMNGTVRYQEGSYVRVEIVGPPRREVNVKASELSKVRR